MNTFKVILYSFALANLFACGEYNPSKQSNSSLPTDTSANGTTKVLATNLIPTLNIDSGLSIIDINSNGVRDDVDAFIKAKYTVAIDIRTATQYAKAAQMGIAGAGVMINDVHEATVNTKDRLMAYRETKSATSGQTWVATEADPKTFCKK